MPPTYRKKVFAKYITWRIFQRVSSNKLCNIEISSNTEAACNAETITTNLKTKSAIFPSCKPPIKVNIDAAYAKCFSLKLRKNLMFIDFLNAAVFVKIFVP